MKNIKNYEFLDRYILRIPLLNYLKTDGLTVNKLREIFDKKEIQEAIYLSSPEFYRELKRNFENKKNEDIEEKLIISLAKYVIRMASRSTPFGLFSGCSIGTFSDNTSIALKSSTAYKRKSRFDMNFICSLIKNVDHDDQIRTHIKYYANSSLSKIGYDYRYIEYKYNNNDRTHYLSSVEVNPYLEEIIKTAKNGASIKELVTLIIDDEITEEDATEFIHELIDNQILISELSPTVTGADYFNRVLSKIGGIKKYEWLYDLETTLKSLDKNTFNNDLTIYNELHENLKANQVQFNEKYLLQSDLVVTTSTNHIDSKVLDSIKKGLSVLNKLKFKRPNDRLSEFKKRFYNRYEDRLIPLSLALDVESGIGFSDKNIDASYYDISPLTEGFEIMFSNKNEKHPEDNRPELILQHLYLEALKNNKDEIVITDEILEGLEESWEEFPKTMAGMIKVLDESDEPQVFMDLFAGPTASLLMGRFGHVDEEFHSLIQAIFEKEQDETKINAEIAHLPQDRLGNITIRENQREYEIPYLAFSTLPVDKQLPIDDLYIKLDNDRIVLFSKKLNKEIVPYLSNAHHFSHGKSLPIYNFLGSLQVQNLYGALTLSLGSYTNYRHIPRISYKNVILSVAQWNINKNEIQKIVQDLDTWIKENNIPQYIVIADDDNELVIDLQNEISRKVFLSTIKKRRQLLLKEFLFKDKKFIVKDENKQGYCHEIITTICVK